ncbi:MULTISPECIES: nuclear transport factor 2 family protein [Corallococcus]|uniref:nuclear transport factor 2 family protein n=1 Tax=Corallococcus TaxID=83461 RepID=UPI001378D78C|nr:MULTISPECIES: nuclear transport factor 2 family protein [Corallococcus]NBD08426.1 DUF4440 domain-containing protein [Corallococcus silvisoli]
MRKGIIALAMLSLSLTASAHEVVLSEADVLKAQTRSTEALVKGDVDAVAQEFSADFSSAGGDFQFKSRDELIRGLKEGNLYYEAIRSEVESVKFTTNTSAVVTGKRTVKAFISGKPFESTFSYKAVYALNQDRWTLVLWAVNPC